MLSNKYNLILSRNLDNLYYSKFKFYKMNSHELETDPLEEISSVIRKMEVELKQDKSRISYVPPQQTELPSFKNIAQNNYQSSKPISNFNAFRPNIQPPPTNQYYSVGNFVQQPSYNQFAQFQNSIPMNTPPTIITQQNNTMPFNNPHQQISQSIPSVISTNPNFPVRINQPNPFDSLLRQSNTNDTNISGNSRIVYKVQKSNENEILQRLSNLEAKVLQYQKKQASQIQKYQSLQMKCEQLNELVNQQQNELQQVKNQNAELAKQIKICNQLQSLYEEELKQYKVKMVILQKGHYNLKQQLGISNGTPTLNSPLEKKKIEVIARIGTAKSPERSSSKTNLSSVIKNGKK